MKNSLEEMTKTVTNPGSRKWVIVALMFLAITLRDSLPAASRGYGGIYSLLVTAATTSGPMPLDSLPITIRPEAARSWV